MRVLITGMTGMAGGFLAEYLTQNQPQVEVFGTFRWRSKLDNLQELRNRGHRQDFSSRRAELCTDKGAADTVRDHHD